MIELPETFRILHGIPYEPIDAVRSDACKAYGDQRAAEAREQMREECVKLIDAPIWLTWDVRAKLITLIRKLP